MGIKLHCFKTRQNLGPFCSFLLRFLILEVAIKLTGTKVAATVQLYLLHRGERQPVLTLLNFYQAGGLCK